MRAKADIGHRPLCPYGLPYLVEDFGQHADIGLALVERPEGRTGLP
jgi:hypothetical protein